MGYFDAPVFTDARVKTFRHVSASQFKLFDVDSEGCKRQWWIEKIAGNEAPRTAAKDKGTEWHKQLEDYYNFGTQPEALSPYLSIPHLPARDPRILIETEIGPTKEKPHLPVRLRFGEIVVTGKVDLTDPSGGPRFPGAPLDPPGVVHILDHKSTSDYKWSLSDDDLLTDLQMGLYSVWALVEFPWATAVRVSHNVMRTKGAGSSVLRTNVLDLTAIQRFRYKAEQLTAEMARWSKAERLQDVPAAYDEKPGDLTACQKYRGCPWQTQCNLSPERRIRMALNDLFSEAPAAPAAPSNPAPSAPVFGEVAAPPPPPKPSPWEKLTTGKLYKLPDGRQGTFRGTSKGFGFFDVEGVEVRFDSEGKIAPVAPVPAVGVNPPDAAPPIKDATAPAAAAVTEFPKGEAPRPAAAPATQPAPVTATTPATEAPAEAPKKRGRKPKAEGTPAATALILLIDAVPVRGMEDAEPLEDVIHDLQAKAAAKLNVSDLRLVEFGKGPGHLAAALRDNPPKGIYTVTTGDVLTNAAVAALIPIADLVIKGSR